MPEYSRQQILDEVGSGKDAQRRKDIDALVARAKAGDQVAMQRIQGLADLDGPGGEGAATRDARNYARLMLNEGFGQSHDYMEKGDGGGFLGSVGGVLKTAAPIGAAFIPGIGPIAAGAIGAAGSAAGGALAGDDFDPLKTLLAGGGAAGGNLLLGGQGIGGIKGIPGRLGMGGSGIPDAPDISQMGDATYKVAAPAAGAGAVAKGGVLGKVGNFLGGGDGFGIDDAVKIGGTVAAIDSMRHANKLQDSAIQGATRDWESRAPLRQMGMSRIMGLNPSARRDMSELFADPSNPYYRAPRPLSERYG